MKSSIMNRHVVLIRNVRQDRQELGNMFVFNDAGKQIFACKTLERAWLDNKQNESCVPIGTYPIVYEWSDRFSMYLWELKEVPGRSECKIHAANYWYQLNGCIAPGDQHIDINGDTYNDVRNSVKTLLRFHEAMGDAKKSIIKIIQL